MAKEMAKKKYARKVCKNYLGISETGCEKAFEKLFDNMKSTFEAMA